MFVKFLVVCVDAGSVIVVVVGGVGLGVVGVVDVALTGIVVFFVVFACDVVFDVGIVVFVVVWVGVEIVVAFAFDGDDGDSSLLTELLLLL